MNKKSYLGACLNDSGLPLRSQYDDESLRPPMPRPVAGLKIQRFHMEVLGWQTAASKPRSAERQCLGGASPKSAKLRRLIETAAQTPLRRRRRRRYGSSHREFVIIITQMKFILAEERHQETADPHESVQWSSASRAASAASGSR